MVEGTSFSGVAAELVSGLADIEEITDNVPGFSLVARAFKAVYDLSNSFEECEEESVRLMAYCATMKMAIFRFHGKVLVTPALTDALSDAATALQNLIEVIQKHEQTTTLVKFFKSQSVTDALKDAEHNVENAVQKAMLEVQLQGIEDAADTRKNVEMLLQRGCALACPPHRPTRDTACSSHVMGVCQAPAL
jgi:hypothetical protein